MKVSPSPAAGAPPTTSDGGNTAIQKPQTAARGAHRDPERSGNAGERQRIRQDMCDAEECMKALSGCSRFACRPVRLRSAKALSPLHVGELAEVVFDGDSQTGSRRLPSCKMKVENWALVFSALSLFIAGLALAWRIIDQLLVDRARLRVTVEPSQLVSPVSCELIYTVTATNVGKRPTQLSGLLLAMGRRRKFIPNRFRRQPLVTMNPSDLSSDTVLPVTLDVGGRAQLFYDRAAVIRASQEVGVGHIYAVAWASTAQAFAKAIKLDPDSPR